MITFISFSRTSTMRKATLHLWSDLANLSLLFTLFLFVISHKFMFCQLHVFIFKIHDFGVNSIPSLQASGKLFCVPGFISGASKHNLLCSLEHEFSSVELALLIDGARRVGKSYIVEEFAKNEYTSYILVNFANITIETIFIIMRLMMPLRS